MNEFLNNAALNIDHFHLPMHSVKFFDDNDDYFSFRRDALEQLDVGGYRSQSFKIPLFRISPEMDI